jgi:hypothetical protein
VGQQPEHGGCRRAVLAECTPNRLFKVLMLDAPTAFSAIWSVVSGFLTEITKAKITFTTLGGAA